MSVTKCPAPNLGFYSMPECGWPCRLNEENSNRIDLNDGSSLVLEANDRYTWYDIEGKEQETFIVGTVDFDSWRDVHNKLKAALQTN